MALSEDEKKAVQQFIGFNSAKQGHSIDDLAIAMGLNENEWKRIKEEGEHGTLSREDIELLDEHFEDKKETRRSE